MKAEFSGKWELVITAENVLESLALQAWLDKYNAEEAKDTDKGNGYLLVKLFREVENET